MKFITSFYYSFGSKIISLIILLISRVLTSHILGPADLGSIGNALNFTTIVSRMGSLGIAPATQFTSSKYPLQKNTLFIYVIFSSVLTGILNFILLIYFEKEILDWQFHSDGNAQLAYRQFVPLLPINILSMTLPILLLGANRIKEYSLTQVLPLLLQTVIIVLTYFLQKSIDFIILAQLVYWITTVIISLTFINYKSFRFEFDKNLWSIFARYSFKAWPQVVLQFGITRFAVLIGSQYLNNENLGYYILASNLSESFLVINASVTPLIFNKIASTGADIKLLGTSLRFSILLLLPIFFVTILFGKPVFIYFFGIEFDPTWNLLLILLFSVLFQSMLRICLNYMSAMGKNGIVSIIQVIQLSVLLISSLIICPVFGVSGLCYSIVCAAAIGFCFALLALKKLDSRNISVLFIPAKDDMNLLLRILKYRQTNFK